MYRFALCFVCLLISIPGLSQEGKHLFILSGQSNMARLDAEESFSPTLEAEFGGQNILIVKDALGGAPIRRWYRNWIPESGDKPVAESDLYDSLWEKVSLSMKGEKVATITFIWMQGERDAREEHGVVYGSSLLGLYNQLCSDLKRKDVNFIIGRINDFDMRNATYPHWTLVREMQVKIALSNSRFDWVNTDDLNDGVDRKGKAISNDLHMSRTGYIELGKRFAQKSIELIKARK